jgi:hypothetical protein
MNVSRLEGDFNTLIRIWIQQLNLMRIRILNLVSTVTNKLIFVRRKPGFLTNESRENRKTAKSTQNSVSHWSD